MLNPKDILLKRAYSINVFHRRNLKIFLSFFLLLFYCSVLAQNEILIKGNCVDSLTKAPIFGATVLLTSDGEILAYNITDDRGSFKFAVPVNQTLKITLTCRHISFLEKSIFISTGNIADHYNLEMVASSKTLSEITIKSEKWMKNDTTNFIIDSSANLASKKVEDLLKTLPGFEMIKNGQIKYNDRMVGTLLINGENLTGSNYGVITKNLDADVLKQVQVIDNFSENRIIGSIFKTGDLAVNLLTKDEINGKINGSAKLSSSFFEKYDNDINLIGIKKRKQLLISGNLNNTGQDKNPDFNSSDKGTFYTLPSPETNYFYASPLLSLNDNSLPENYKPDEKAGYILPSVSFPLSEKVRLIARANFKFTESDISNSSFNKTRIDDSLSYITNNEIIFKNNESLLSGSVLFKFDNLKNSALNLEFKANLINKKANLSDIQSGNYIDSILVNSKIPLYNLNLFVSGASRISPKSAVGFGINANSSNDRGFVEFSTKRFASFFGLPENYSFLRQNENQKNNVIISDLFFVQRLKTGSRNIKLSNVYYSNNIKRFVFLDSIFIMNKSPLVSVGEKRLKYNKYFLEIVENHSAQRTPFNFSAAIGRYDIEDSSNSKYLYYSVSFAISKKLNKRLHLSTTLFSGNNLPSAAVELKDSLITGVSSIQVSTGVYKPVAVSKIAISLNRDGWIKSALSYKYSWQPVNYTTTVFYDPKITFYGFILTDKKIVQSASLKFKSYSMKAKGTFVLSFPIEEERSFGIVNEKNVEVIFRNFIPSLKYVSNFKKKYNFEINYRENIFSFMQRGSGEIKSNSNSLSMDFAQRFDLSKRFIVGSFFSIQAFKTGNFSQLDLFSIWQYNKRLRLDLKGVNLLNQRSYKSEFVDANNAFRFETFATKPYFLIGVNYSF